MVAALISYFAFAKVWKMGERRDVPIADVPIADVKQKYLRQIFRAISFEDGAGGCEWEESTLVV